jgi:hypothetical protein
LVDATVGCKISVAAATSQGAPFNFLTLIVVATALQNTGATTTTSPNLPF